MIKSYLHSYEQTSEKYISIGSVCQFVIDLLCSNPTWVLLKVAIAKT